MGGIDQKVHNENEMSVCTVEGLSDHQEFNGILFGECIKDMAM